jgi:hypothetical protein
VLENHPAADLERVRDVKELACGERLPALIAVQGL